jgi:tyrosine-protein kinase Etk/Wzc
VSPNKPLVLALAAMLGLGLGAGMVFVRKAMDRAADDPDEIEASTGIPVYVTIPHSSKQGSVTRAARRHPGNRLPLLSSIDAGDAAVESLRVLRTSLQVELATAKNNIIAVGGPSPGVGKTFVCVNLADVLASAGQRVLLVDGDLRRGTVHRYFGLDRGPGISEALSGDMVLTAALRSTSVPNLDVLTTGKTPRNPAELLAGTRFQIFLEGLSKRYDLVVVDTPPVLAVADAALIASQAGLNLLVLKAGRHPLGEIALAVKRIEQGGGEVSGIVVNDVRYVTGRYGRDGQYQRYEYRSIERE